MKDNIRGHSIKCIDLDYLLWQSIIYNPGWKKVFEDLEKDMPKTHIILESTPSNHPNPWFEMMKEAQEK